jgi:RNA polymerase sigma factor (sigma-70 family)
MSDLAAVAFRRYYDDLFRFVRRRSRSADDAEEITQAVFVQAAEQLAVRPAPGSLSAWLYTVARNRLIDEARRRSRRVSLLSSLKRPSQHDPRGTEARSLLPCVRRWRVYRSLSGRLWSCVCWRVGASPR